MVIARMVVIILFTETFVLIGIWLDLVQIHCKIYVICHSSMLQIRRGKRGNLGIILILLHQNMLRPIFRTYNEGSQHVFIERYEKICL